MRQSLTPTAIILNEAKALPNATTNYSDSYQHYSRDYRTIIRVYANTAISIADTKALSFALQVSDDDSSFTTLKSSMHSVTASGAAVTYSAGELICEQVVPEKFVSNGQYVRVAITTTADESSEKVDLAVDAL